VPPLIGDRDQPAELLAVQLVLGDTQQVAGGQRLDRIRKPGLAEEFAEPGDATLDLAPSGGRWIIAPDRVDELLDRGQSVRLEGERRQHDLLPWTADFE
jgi:hypothetical protein